MMRGMTLPHRIVGVVLLLTTGWFLAACASQPRPAAVPVAATSAQTSPPFADTPTIASPAETCQALTDMDVLQAAEGFVIIGGAVQPGDVTDALQALDTAVTDGFGATVDTSTVQPDSNLLAGMCRARGLSIPTVL